MVSREWRAQGRRDLRMPPPSVRRKYRSAKLNYMYKKLKLRQGGADQVKGLFTRDDEHERESRRKQKVLQKFAHIKMIDDVMT